MGKTATRIIKRQLKKLGYDMNKPKETSLKIIKEQIDLNINGGFISKQEMIKVLKDHISRIENK